MKSINFSLYYGKEWQEIIKMISLIKVWRVQLSNSFRLILKGLNNDQNGLTYKIENPMIVGRSRNCAIFISDALSSRQQARFFRNDLGELFVEDLNSLNGTFLNGRQVRKHRLELGDIVRLGTTDFEVIRNAVDISVEVVEPVFEDGNQIVKSIATIEIPSLKQMQAQGFMRHLSPKGSDRTQELIEHHKLVKDLQRKTRNFATLFDVSNVIAENKEMQSMLHAVLDILLKVPGGDFAYLALLENGELVSKASRVTVSGREHFVLSQNVSRYVLKEQCAVLAPDLRSDARFSAFDSIVSGITGSIMATPLLKEDGSSWGLLALCSTESQKELIEEDLDLLCVVAHMVNSALENIRLNEQRETHIKALQDANRKILETQEQLLKSERMAAIGRLSSGVIHEVRNHMSPLMLADMIMEQYPDDDDIQSMAEMVIEARTRILDLVDEVRMFAQGDVRSYNMQPHSLDQICHRVIRFVKCDAKVHNIQVNYSCQSDITLIVDEAKIKQVLINLLQNAADALAEIDEPLISITLKKERGFVCIQIEDNGVGIPLELQRKIFDPMFTTKGDKGLGLGLDISKQIMKDHEGILECTSSYGVGTTFKMLFPENKNTSDFWELSKNTGKA